jgi:hypothetical protein
MVKVVVDASKAPDAGFTTYTGPMPPNGLYKCVLKSAWWGKSKNDVPMLTCVLEFKAKSAEKAKYDGYAIWLRITHQESTLWRMKLLFAALGQPSKASFNVTEKTGPFGKIVSHIGRAQVGKAELLVKTKTEKYEGTNRLAVDTMTPLPGVTVEDFDEGDETSFDESKTLTDGMIESDDDFANIDPSDDTWEQSGATDDPPF